MAFVYKITNIINNKSYIGWTKNSVEARWAQHNKSALKENTNRKFYNAIKKYGSDKWKVETLVEVETNNDAKRLEIEFIEQYDTYYNGYNGTKGGDGNNGIIQSDLSNKKRSIALKGKKKPDGFNIGRVQSEETKKKISEKHIGMKKHWISWTPEQIDKRSKKRRALTKQQYCEMMELRRNGFITKDIANKIGVSNDVVKKWIHKTW